MAAARAERDHQLHGRVVAGDTGTGHPFWHTTYIGLGYLPNDWDIRYYDAIAYRDVLREDPKARFLGPAYGRILRDRYFKLVSSQPLFALKDYGAKLLVSLRPATPALLALALAAPWLLLVDARRRRWRRDALFLVLAAAIGACLAAACHSRWLVSARLAGRRPAGGDPRGGGDPRRVAITRGRWGSSCARPARVRRAPRGLVAGSVAAAWSLIVIGVAIAPAIQDTAQHWHDEIPTPHVNQPPDATH